LKASASEGYPAYNLIRKYTGMPEAHYSKEEFARRGNQLYQSKVRALVEVGNEGKVVAIDIDSGEFEVAEDTLAASDRLLVRCPTAQTWFVRIGRPTLHRFGSRRFSESV
jgi:hypothetical protein